MTLDDKKSIKDYTDAMTEATKCALVELWIALEEYHDDIAVIGGWAPYFLTQGDFKHCGSEDIDLVVRTEIPIRGKSICEIIKQLGYAKGGCANWRFSKLMTYPFDAQKHTIRLDFICRRENAQESRHDRAIHKGQAWPKASAYLGTGFALDFNYEQPIETISSAGNKVKTRVKVADLVGSLASKTANRKKDCYDVFVLTHYNGGAEEAARYFNKRVFERATCEENQELKRVILKTLHPFKDKSGGHNVQEFTGGEYNKEIVTAQVKEFLDGISEFLEH